MPEQTGMPGSVPAGASGAAGATTPNGADDPAVLRQQIANLQSVLGRQSQELGVLRRQNRQPAHQQPQEPNYRQPAYGGGGFDNSAGDPEEDIYARPQGMAPRSINDVRRLDLIEFRQLYPDWREAWDEMTKLLQDPGLVDELMHYRDDAQQVPDFLATYRAAYKEHKYRQLLSMQQAQKDAQARLDAEADLRKRQGILSGGSATGGGGQPPTIDLNDPRVTSDDILKSGMLPIDPSDPPRLRG